MSVYVLAAVDIKDAARYQLYIDGAMAMIGEHPAEALVLADSYDTLEGTAPAGRLVVMRFPDRASADAWYNSAGYQAAMQHRLASAETPFLVMAEGLDVAGGDQ